MSDERDEVLTPGELVAFETGEEAAPRIPETAQDPFAPEVIPPSPASFSYRFQGTLNTSGANPRRVAVSDGRFMHATSTHDFVATTVDLPDAAGTYYVQLEVDLDDITDKPTLGYGTVDTYPTNTDEDYYWVLFEAEVESVDSVNTVTSVTPHWTGGNIHLTRAT